MKIVRSALVVILLAAGPGLLAAPATAYPAGVRPTSQINATVFEPGQTVTVTVQNTTPGPLTMQIFSAPVTIGTGTVGANASGAVSGVIPAGYSGQHTIQVTGAGGEIFPYAIVVRGGGGAGGGGCLITTEPPSGRAVDAHSVEFSIVRCVGRGQTATATLSSSGSAWRATATTAADADGLARFADVTVTDGVNALPDGTSTVFVNVSAPNGAGGSGSFAITVSAATGPPTTGSPTIPPTSSPAPTTNPATSVPTSRGRGGTLASTGAQVGLGVGLGVITLVTGGVLLVASRRRSPRHGA